MDIPRLKSLLLDKRQALIDIQETGKQAAEIVMLDQASVGRLSRIDALQRQAMAIASNQRNQIALHNIETALQRIEQNEYGLCLECDEDIAESRLQLDPATSLCIDCATKKEST